MGDLPVGNEEFRIRLGQPLHRGLRNAVGDVRVTPDDFGVDVAHSLTDDRFRNSAGQRIGNK